jgi:hypothetical protein
MINHLEEFSNVFGEYLILVDNILISKGRVVTSVVGFSFFNEND